jgi:hypothetical protein
MDLMRTHLQKLQNGLPIMALSLLGNSAAATTCTPVTSSYVVDTHVRYVVEDRAAQPATRRTRVVRGADPKSFQVLRHPVQVRGPCDNQRIEYGRDRYHVFYQWKLIPGADPQSYAFLDAHYARDKAAIYSHAKRLSTRRDSFQLLSGGYASDGQRHFFQDIVIKGPGFELLGGEAQAGRGYARTRDAVYHKGQLIRHADARTFELYKPEVGITRDKRAVYFDDHVITNADPTTFEQVVGYTFKDRHGVYTEGRKLDGINPTSVRATEFGNYLVDDQAVFKAGKRLPGRDAATFSELQHPWSRDKHGAYYQDTVVPDVDLASFKTTGLDRAEDRNYRYNGPRPACKFDSSHAAALPVCAPGKTP